MRWLPRFFPAALIRVHRAVEPQRIHFALSFFSKPLLVLQYVQGSFEDDRQKFHIVGGILSRTTDSGWLEFRQVSQRKFTLAAIHEFVPSLPWVVYIFTQALLHQWVMKRFGQYLAKYSK
jgi:hypothetical protein